MKKCFSFVVLSGLVAFIAPRLACAEPPATTTIATTAAATHPATAPTTSASQPSTHASTTQPGEPSKAAPGPAAHADQIRDDARFFDAETIQRAADKIDAIHRRFGKQVVVETYEVIPEDHKRQFEETGKEVFFKDWLRDRAKARNTDGIFVLIVRHPGRLQMAAGAKTKAKLFTADDVDALDAIMNGPFRERDYNVGLMRGLNFIEKRMEKNAAAAGKP